MGMKTDKRDLLLENARDALLALAMEDLAQEEGGRWEAENRRLQDDPACALPESVDQRSVLTIRRAIKRKDRRRAGPVIRRAVTRFAVVFLAVFLLFSGTFFTVSAVRNATLGFLVTEFGKGGVILPENMALDDDPGFGPRWLPPGFEAEILLDTDDMCVVRYNYDDGAHIEYGEQVFDSMTVLDTEDVQFWEREISGRTVLFAKKNGTISCWWTETREGTEWLCGLMVYGFDEETTESILRSLN